MCKLRIFLIFQTKCMDNKEICDSKDSVEFAGLLDSSTCQNSSVKTANNGCIFVHDGSVAIENIRKYQGHRSRSYAYLRGNLLDIKNSLTKKEWQRFSMQRFGDIVFQKPFIISRDSKEATTVKEKVIY